MIFVTVGTQEPFDRLIAAIDTIAPHLNGLPILAQVARSKYVPQHIKTVDFLPPAIFNSYFSQAKLIVGHAGMGTIISALQQEKPIIVLPRLAELKEHRNDHQLATANAFDKLKYIHVVYDEKELKEKISDVWNGQLKYLHKLGQYASAELISSLQNFVVS